MNKVKRQHTVPRTYLKNFTQDGKNLFLFDKVLQRSNKASIRHVAVSKSFYDITREAVKAQGQSFVDMDVQVIEKFLAIVEDDFGPTLHNILTLNQSYKMSRIQKRDMAYFMAMQFVRTEEFRRQFIDLRQEAMQKLVDDSVKINFSSEYHHLSPRVSYDESFDSLAHGQWIANSETVTSFAKMFYSHIWQIGINRTRIPLYTSDSPIVRFCHIERLSPTASDIRNEGTNLISEIVTVFLLPGIAEEGVEVAYPISSEKILLLKDRKHFSQEEDNDGGILDLSYQEVKRYNRLQVEQSTRQIFCRDDDFDLARQMCLEDSSICSAERSRVIVDTTYSHMSEKQLEKIRNNIGE